MKKDHTAPPLLAAACAALFCLLAPAAEARAQARPPQPHRPPGEGTQSPTHRPISEAPPSIRERQLKMRDMESEMSRPEPVRRPSEEAMAEVAQDYRRIQLVNNKMMGKVMPAAAPDYRLVEESAGEIRKIAERLRHNLMLPEPAAEPAGAGKAAPAAAAPAETAEQLKKALLLLDRSLMSFVRSPLFQNTEVLDAGAATKASRDLADVIARSRLAAADAERLRKKGQE